jgi:hypothetical protein
VLEGLAQESGHPGPQAHRVDVAGAQLGLEV